MLSIFLVPISLLYFFLGEMSIWSSSHFLIGLCVCVCVCVKRDIFKWSYQESGVCPQEVDCWVETEVIGVAETNGNKAFWIPTSCGLSSHPLWVIRVRSRRTGHRESLGRHLVSGWLHAKSTKGVVGFQVQGKERWQAETWRQRCVGSQGETMTWAENLGILHLWRTPHFLLIKRKWQYITGKGWREKYHTLKIYFNIAWFCYIFYVLIFLNRVLKVDFAWLHWIFVAVCGLLMAVARLVAEHRL